MRRPLPRLALWATKVARVGSSVSFEEQRRLAEEYDAALPRLGDAYERIACPVILVAASRADRVPRGEEILKAVNRGVEDFRERHPGVRVERLTSGHDVPRERPRELTSLIAGLVQQ